MCFGNVSSVTSFSEIMDSPSHQSFTNQTLRIPDKCKACPMQSFCHNGCVAHRINDGDTSPHYAYCGSRLAFYDHLTKYIEATNSSSVVPHVSVPSILGN